MKSAPNWLLSASAVVYFAAAIPLMFAPEETSALLGGSAAGGQIALLQVLGSALFGFALLNWSNRFSRLGGIFGKPLILANLAHAMTAFLLLVRVAIQNPGYLPVTLPTAVYLALALAFATRLLVAPSPERE
jgi:hypothetical protein